jgi:hypothetical protein
MYRFQFRVVVPNFYTKVSVMEVGFYEEEIVDGESLP